MSPPSGKSARWIVLTIGILIYVVLVYVAWRWWWGPKWEWSRGGPHLTESWGNDLIFIFANAAAAVGILLAVIIFVIQKRDSDRALDTTVSQLQGTKKDLWETKEDLDHAIKRLGQEISVLKEVSNADDAISMLRGWFTENADRKLTHFWWRSGYSAIPVFWADAEKCAEVVRLICGVDHNGVSLTGPQQEVFDELATSAAEALLKGMHLTDERVKRWKDDLTTMAPIKERIRKEYEGLIDTCILAKPCDSGKFPGRRNLELRSTPGVNWAIAKFEIIVFRDKTDSEEPRFLAEPTIHKTNNPTLAELIIQEFKPESIAAGSVKIPLLNS